LRLDELLVDIEKNFKGDKLKDLKNIK